MMTSKPIVDPASWPAVCPDGLGCEHEFHTLPASSAPTTRHRQHGSPACEMAKALNRPLKSATRSYQIWDQGNMPGWSWLS